MENGAYDAAREVLPKLLKMMKGGRIRTIHVERAGSDVMLLVDTVGRKSAAEWHRILEERAVSDPVIGRLLSP